MTRLDKLIARLEAGDDGQSLDAAIFEELGQRITWIQAYREVEEWALIAWQPPHPYAGLKQSCPAITTSLDAAVALVAWILPGWYWMVGYGVDGITAAVAPKATPLEDEKEGAGSTIAAALTCAALKAKREAIANA